MGKISCLVHYQRQENHVLLEPWHGVITLTCTQAIDPNHTQSIKQGCLTLLMKIFYTQFKIAKIDFHRKSHTQANGSFAHCQHDLKFSYVFLCFVNVRNPK
jgi:hypothetical protein